MKKALFAAAALLAAACQQDAGGNTSDSNDSAPRSAAKGEQSKTNLLQALGGSADHKTLASVIRAAGLDETLSGAQPYTVFAPTEAAFEKRSTGPNEPISPEAKGRMVALLTGHIVPGFVTADDLGRAIERGKGKAQLATVGGSTLTFSRDGEAVIVTDAAGGRARIIGDEQLASNGVVHSVDGVLKSK